MWKNKDILREQNIIVPPQKRYSTVLPMAMKHTQGSPATNDFEEAVLDKILVEDDCKRLVLSFENALCLPPYAFNKDRLYAGAGFKLRWLRNVFPNHDVEFTFGIQNPATFIQGLCPSSTSYESLINETPLDEILWSEVIQKIRKTCPDVPLNVFAFEDTPVVWPKILRQLCGASPDVLLHGELDILNLVMQRDGMKRLRTYLEAHPTQDPEHKQHILQTYLEKYVNESALETSITLPGWDTALVEELTGIYETDLASLEADPRINFIV
jgi:hypothetical protein